MSPANQAGDGNGWRDPVRQTGSTHHSREAEPALVLRDDKEHEKTNGFAALGARQVIVIIESNPFLRDCLRRSVTDCSHDPTIGCASIAELAQVLPDDCPSVVVLSTLSLSDKEKDEELERLAQFDPRPHTMVLAKDDDVNDVLSALSRGAGGYISLSSGFDIFIEALRFVRAGGTYVPAQCLLETRKVPAAAEPMAGGPFSNREMAVIQAIRDGKPNKVIAYELNMCESTVKVHVRHIMKKIHARNRTEVAIKSASMLS
jgi:DNA-binding NarL/FixJ family response regulator